MRLRRGSLLHESYSRIQTGWYPLAWVMDIGVGVEPTMTGLQSVLWPVELPMIWRKVWDSNPWGAAINLPVGFQDRCNNAILCQPSVNLCRVLLVQVPHFPILHRVQIDKQGNSERLLRQDLRGAYHTAPLVVARQLPLPILVLPVGFAPTLHLRN